MTQTLLEIVKQSPAACQVHDKEKWMSLFDHYHIVEDPVGSSPHIGGIYSGKDKFRGNGALSRFFDTFIAPNDISFDIKKDIVKNTHVVRDLNININMSDKVKVSVPMHLLYELRASGDTYRIARLAAHWEFLPMIGQLMGKGSACLPVAMNLTVRMLKYQGLSGTLGFSSAAFNIGKAGRQVAESLLQCINQRDLPGVVSCFCHDEVSIQGLEGSEKVHPSILLDSIPFASINTDKVIVAGDTVSMSVVTDTGASGVVFVEFDGKQKKISQCRFYLTHE